MGAQPAGADRAKGQGNRETWRDWLPPGADVPAELLTREQILERLRRWRVEATEADLRYWEYEGILPRPVRQWHKGATRAVYPSWFPILVRQLRRLQREGLNLGEIAVRLRNHARLLLAHDDDEVGRQLRRLAPPGATTPEDISLPAELTIALERFARLHERFRDVPVARVEVHVIGTDGRATRYPFPIAGDEEQAAGDQPPSES